MNAANRQNKTLLIGIGNDGRGDDALGWMFADHFAEHPALDVVQRYQLQVEDAELIRHYSRVVFADATHAYLPEGFAFTSCTPIPSVQLSTHALDPATVLWLAAALYGAEPEGFVMAMQGMQWELGDRLSPGARLVLERATAYFLYSEIPNCRDLKNNSDFRFS